MMARSLKGSNNRPDTEAQDQPSPNHHFRLATRGRSIQKGQQWTLEAQQEARSGLAAKGSRRPYMTPLSVFGVAWARDSYAPAVKEGRLDARLASQW